MIWVYLFNFFFNSFILAGQGRKGQQACIPLSEPYWVTCPQYREPPPSKTPCPNVDGDKCVIPLSLPLCMWRSTVGTYHNLENLFRIRAPPHICPLTWISKEYKVFLDAHCYIIHKKENLNKCTLAKSYYVNLASIQHQSIDLDYSSVMMYDLPMAHVLWPSPTGLSPQMTAPQPATACQQTCQWCWLTLLTTQDTHQHIYYRK